MSWSQDSTLAVSVHRSSSSIAGSGNTKAVDFAMFPDVLAMLVQDRFFCETGSPLGWGLAERRTESRSFTNGLSSASIVLPKRQHRIELGKN